MVSAEPMTVAELVARYLARAGVIRIYGICGGHIQPIWDAVSRVGIEVVDVRHESAAVFMAHAESELTGRIGVAMVTAGPGLTNAVTAIANASVSRIPLVVISGRPPRPQAGRGAMQELDQSEIVRPLCRSVIAVHDRAETIGSLESTFAASLGALGSSGPAYIDFPTDLLRETVDGSEAGTEGGLPAFVPGQPENSALEAAAVAIRDSRRPVVISGRSVHVCPGVLAEFLDSTGALYLDSPSSRGAISAAHHSYVPAARSRVMGEADLVITVGRTLDYQLGYGSAAVFPAAKCFVRIGTEEDEVKGGVAGVEVLGMVCSTLGELVSRGALPSDPDRKWLRAIRESNGARVDGLTAKMRDAGPDGTGQMHPYRLIHAINDVLEKDSVVVADGGDILSFARVGLRPVRQLDCGALGCLGVGVPFATSAAMNTDGPTVFGLIGDGAFGLSAMELDTARRIEANVVFIVANNQGWNIERHDQIDRYEGNVVGVDLPDCRYDLIAKGLGLYAERIETPEDLVPALRRAISNTPALLDVSVSRDAQSPDYLSGMAGVPTLQPLTAWSDAESALTSAETH